MRGCLVACLWLMLLALFWACNSHGPEATRFIEDGLLCVAYDDGTVSCEVLP